MGFTFSHPALVIPFRYLPRKWYSVTGLIAGSMVPDVEYFIRHDTMSKYSHTIYGLFWFDIPMAILVSLIFHGLVRDILISNLPSFLKFRLNKYRNNNWFFYLKNNWFIVLFSILIGAITHLIWDSFTSIEGYFIKSIPFFTHKYYFLNESFYFYKIVKYISSILGAMVIAYQLYKFPAIDYKEGVENKYYWIILIILSLLVFIFRLYTTEDYVSFNGFMKISISSGLLALLLSSLYYKKKYLFEKG